MDADINPKPPCGHEKLVRLAIEWDTKLDMIQRDPRTVTPESLAETFNQFTTELHRLKEAH